MSLSCASALVDCLVAGGPRDYERLLARALPALPGAHLLAAVGEPAGHGPPRDRAGRRPAAVRVRCRGEPARALTSRRATHRGGGRAPRLGKSGACPGREASARIPEPSPEALRRWRSRLADEREEGKVYRSLASRRHGRGAGDPAGHRRGRGTARGALGVAARRRGRAGPARRAADAAAGVARAPLRLRVRAGAGAAGRDAVAVRHRSRRHPRDGRGRADARGDRPRPGRARPGPGVRHLPGGGVRRERRPGEQPRARARGERRRGRAERRAAHRHRGAARRRAVDGRRRVHLGPLAARAARRLGARRGRAPRRPAPRRRRERAGAGLPGQGHAAPTRPRSAHAQMLREHPTSLATPGEPARGPRRRRHGPRCRAVQLLLLRLGRRDPDHPVPVRARRDRDADRVRGARGAGADADRGDRRAAVRRPAAAPRAAAAGDRPGRRRRHLPARAAVRRHPAG